MGLYSKGVDPSTLDSKLVLDKGTRESIEFESNFLRKTLYYH